MIKQNDTTTSTMSGVSGDTGLWLLTVDMSPTSLRGWLREYVDPSAAMRPMADVRWSGDDSLENIENAVYDNPVILDDFEADIVITTPRFIFLPNEFKNNLELCNKAYSAVYGETSIADIMTDDAGAYVCVYMPVAGLRGFLGRTFSGSRISCHITGLVRYWQSLAGSGASLFSDIRPGAIDMALFVDGHLHLAVRKRCNEMTDAVYYLLTACRQSTLDDDLSSVTVSLSGDEKESNEVTAMIRDYVKEVKTTPHPDADGSIPLADQICSYRKSSAI